VIVSVYIVNGIRVNGHQDLTYGPNIKPYKFRCLTIYVLSLITNMSNLAELNIFKYNNIMFILPRNCNTIPNQKSVIQAMKCLMVTGYVWILYVMKFKVDLMSHYLMGLLHVINMSRGTS
jgi:hypothetical protein